MPRLISLSLAALAALSGPAQAAPKASPRAIVEASLAAVNRHDAAGIAALYAKDAVVISSADCKPEIGPEAVRAGHEFLFKKMPDLRFEARSWVVQGDQVALLFVAHSKSMGPMGGAEGEATFADFFTVKGGKIVRDVTIFNPGKPCR